jgi:two-component system sensor histidine kinase TtrS
MRRFYLLWLWLLLSSATVTATNTHNNHIVRIGVLNHRSESITFKTWQATADYLTAQLPPHQFVIIPIAFSDIDEMVARHHVDFILVNPSLYIELAIRHGVLPIATLNKRIGKHHYNQFASVIFTLKNNQQRQNLQDLKGCQLAAVDPHSFGGFQMAWYLLEKSGINLYQDLAGVTFTGSHDAVVAAVLHGQVDVGIVRSGILEKLAATGAIQLEHIHIINPQSLKHFPYYHSTALYPEWPLSKLSDTSPTLALQVAVTLLHMSTQNSADSQHHIGWSVPSDYSLVQTALRALDQLPYQQPLFTFQDALHRYWGIFLFSISMLLALLMLIIRVLHLNTQLANAKLRLEQREQSILDSVAEGIYGVDLDGRITFVNQAIERLSGWSAVNVLGQHEHQLLHHTHANGEPYPIQDCPVHATLLDSQSRFIEEDVFWHQKGYCFPVEYSVTPVRDEHNCMIGAVVVIRDITERHKNHEHIHALELAQAHAARLSTVGELASGLGHELNQPLTVIQTKAQACLRLLKKKEYNAELCQSILTSIAKQSARAGEIIQHMRQLARKEESDLTPVTIASLFETVSMLLYQDARRADIVIRYHIASDVNQVMARRIQIEQVLLNLARNGLEAMIERQGERRLLLSAQRLEDNLIEIRVVDTGLGLPRGAAQHIFEPFFTTKPQGLGLGLSISERIVEAHGSHLQVETTPDIGTTFFFTLPCA